MEQKFTQLQLKIEADAGFGEKLFSLETPEEVQNLLKDEGLEFSLEEINMLRDGIIKIMEKGENGELSDEDLEDVAGGIAVTTVCSIIIASAAVVSAGAAVGGTTIAAATFTHKVTRGRW